ncbi:MAG: pre-16S rRNA-processing nuclease YqgF [Veillonellaceae bacterium]|jgi:RNase H-fold protein (predicted Holliday junction resolvase)|nr:pre-16S rRNA-processing nuclease YqgF [Veillonellaceae bacterium]
MEDLVISVDPGREKCGIAVVHKTKGVLHKKVIGTIKLAETIAKLAIEYNVAIVLLGNRTTSRESKNILENIKIKNRPLIIKLVDEHRSTDAARQRYWQENPPRGLKRLIPVTMQVPPVPVDDYVAVILAERYFKSPLERGVT